MRDRSLPLRLLAALVLAGALDAGQEGTPPPAGAQVQSGERAFGDDLAQKMRHLPFFSRHGFDKVEDVPGYWILVQRSDQSSPDRSRELARAAVELLGPTRERFERERAEPLGLVRREDRPRLVLAILGSRADYDECYRDTTAAWHYEAQATFERELGAAILYAVDGRLDGDAERVRGARHMLVHALQQAWYGADGAAPVRSWLFEGMADFLSFEPGDADALPARVRQFAADAADPRSRWVNLRTLAELCTVDEPLALGEFFAAHAPELQPSSDGDPWAAFYREGALLYRFLHESDDGRYRKALLAYEKRAFRGAHELADLAASLAPRKLPDLQRSFLDWIHEQHRAAFPDVPLERDLVRSALDRTDAGQPILPDEATPASSAPASKGDDVPPAPKAKPAESRPPDVATPPAVVAPSSNAPASIPYDDVSPEERYAAALADIGAGRVRAASDALAALSPEVAATGLGPRVAREQERVAAWTAARDAFFAKAAAEDLTLELSVARVSTTKWRLRGVEDGQAVLDDRKGGVKRVPVEDLDPLALARQMDGVEPSWTRFYVYVLREDERWKKLLKEDGGPASALLEDARTDYPRLVRLGRAVAGLRALASEPAATAEGELERQLGILRILLAELGDTELVERKRELLRDHALALLERRFTLQNPLKRLAGKAELAGKRLRVAYDFSDARQLADFDPAPYPLLASKGFSGPEGEEGSFTVSEGRLVATGRASLRTVYDLGAPMAVHYDVEFVDQQAPDPHFHLALGVCDDGQEHFLWAINLNVLQLLDRSATDYTEDPPRALYLDTRYAMELEHDGQRVTLRCEGLEQATLGAGNRSSGAVFLRAVGTIPVRVDALVIEGQLLPESFVRMQRSWAEAQMAAW